MKFSWVNLKSNIYHDYEHSVGYLQTFSVIFFLSLSHTFYWVLSYAINKGFFSYQADSFISLSVTAIFKERYIDVSCKENDKAQRAR